MALASQTICSRILNALLFVRDPGNDPMPDEIPNVDGRGVVWHTDACLAVGCLPDCFGATTITLGSSNVPASGRVLVFDGLIKTPSRAVIVGTVLAEELLRARVENATTRVRIWTDGQPDADVVLIGLD